MGFRYIGAKTKLLDKILDQTSQITKKGGRVVDLMCGTGTVSAALRQRGFSVTAVDVLTFCCVHAKVALLFTEPPTFSEAQYFIDEYSCRSQETLFGQNSYEKLLNALNSLPGEKGYFWQEFSPDGCPKNSANPRQYFTTENAMKIDAIRRQIKEHADRQKINDTEHSLLLHDLIMATNDVANIAGTYGHFLSKMVQRAKSPIVLKPSTILLRPDAGSHRVLKGYAEDLAPILECDLCYIDPPYMKRQYAANYHILETIAREDEPEAIGVSGLRPWRDQYSNFCTKTKIRGSFSKIFTLMNCKDFLISYSNEGLLTPQELEHHLSLFGKVTITSFKYKRFKSRNDTSISDTTEYLFHLKKE